MNIFLYYLTGFVLFQESFSAITRPSPNSIGRLNVTDACLNCICHATSGCQEINCVYAGPERYYCGPYEITWSYWAQAGRFEDEPEDPFSFERCLVKRDCSEKTVRGFMEKFATDCDDNQVVTCSDFARIHKAESADCSDKLIETTEYWNTFTECLRITTTEQ